MLHLSPMYRIDQGFNNWGVKMYRFRQFCVRFSVLINFFFGFSVQDDFFYGLRFLIGPNAPLLDGLVKLFGSSRNGSQLHMDYAVIHRKVSCQFFYFYYGTVSWSTIKYAIIFLFAWFTSILTLEFIIFQRTKDVGKIHRKREKLLHYMFSRENNGTFFFSWRFLGATQEGSVRVLLSDVLFCRATCYGALV